MRKKTLLKRYKVVCSYCRGHMRGNRKQTLVSHGACKACARKLDKEYGYTGRDRISRGNNPLDRKEWERHPVFPKKGRTGRPRGAAAARVVSYRLYAGTGKPVRIATKVIFPDGREIKFSEKLSKTEAIRKARILYERGDAFSNPLLEKRQFMAAVVSDPFYKTLLLKGASRLIQLLREGTFDRRRWITTIEAVVERVAREKRIRLTRMEKVKLALTLARQLWNTYVHRKS